MKKLLLIIICTICSLGFSLSAQEKCSPEKMREFKEFKMKYIAQEIDLKDSQKDRFFELYEKMWRDKWAAYERVHQLKKKMSSGKDLTDAEYNEYQALSSEARAKDLEIDKRYDAEFLKVITPKQLYKLKEAETKFKDKIREMCSSKDAKKGKKKKHSK